MTATAVIPAAGFIANPASTSVGNSKKPGPTPSMPEITAIGTASAAASRKRSCPAGRSATGRNSR